MNQRFVPVTLLILFLGYFNPTIAQNNALTAHQAPPSIASAKPLAAVSDSSRYIFAKKRSTLIGFNPLHAFFGHLTGYVELFPRKRSRHSHRIGLSVGVNSEKQRYLWAAGVDRKTYFKRHYSPVTGFVGLGILGGQLTKGDDYYKAVGVIEPRALAGVQYQSNDGLYLGLELSGGLPIFINAYPDQEKPFGITAGILIGYRFLPQSPR